MPIWSMLRPTCSGGQVEINPQCFQHIRRAAGRRYRAATVLGHLRARSSSNQRTCRRDIEGVRGITAGAAGIHQMFAIGDRNLGGDFAHHKSSGGNFAYGFFLDSQANENTGNLRGGDFSFHDLAHQ